MEQPKDHVPEVRQVIVENGRASLLFQWVVGVAVAITAAAAIGTWTSVNELNVKMAVVIADGAHAARERSEHDRRIQQLEDERFSRLVEERKELQRLLEEWKGQQ